jgi:hypothetical protein
MNTEVNLSKDSIEAMFQIRKYLEATLQRDDITPDEVINFSLARTQMHANQQVKRLQKLAPN